MDTENQSLFLVFGHARSGTTALARMLNEASKVACLYYESNLLYRLWRNLSRVNLFDEPLDDIVLDFAITAEHNLIQRAGTNRDPQITFSKDSVDILVSAFHGDLQSGDDEYELFSKTAVRFFELFRKIAAKSIVGDKVPDYINIPDIIVPALPDCKVLF